MTNNPPQVVCVGEVLVDIFAETDAGEGCQLSRAARLRPLLGGAPANVCVGLARQGVCCAMLGVVGQDAFGELLREQLLREGVNVSFMGSSESRTGLAFVSRSPAGEPSYLFYRHETADQQLDAAYIERVGAVIARASLLHFCGNTASREPAAEALSRALALGRQFGLLLSLDLNLRLHLWFSRRQAVRTVSDLLARVDVVKGCRDEATEITGKVDPADAARGLLAGGPKLAIVTDGAHGAYFCTASAAGHVPAAVVDVVDTTGAGDAFAATVLAGLVLRPDPVDWTPNWLRALVTRASAAGSHACLAVGATSGLPTAQQLDRIIVAHGPKPAS